MESTLINLTAGKITLIAENGQTTSFLPSGYVARVQMARRILEYPNEQCAMAIHIPLIEETFMDIVFDLHLPGWTLRGIMWEGTEIENHAFLLVSREVAEAAAYYWHIDHGQEKGICLRPQCGPHPLWRRMVWPSDFANYPVAEAPGFGNGWRSLHRVPQEGRRA